MNDGKKCVVHKVAGLLLLIGGLNWGLMAINMDWNIVAMISGDMMWLERSIYGLVGLSAIAMLIKHKCPMCQVDGKMMKKEAPSMGNDQM